MTPKPAKPWFWLVLDPLTGLNKLVPADAPELSRYVTGEVTPRDLTLYDDHFLKALNIAPLEP